MHPARIARMMFMQPLSGLRMCMTCMQPAGSKCILASFGDDAKAVRFASYFEPPLVRP